MKFFTYLVIFLLPFLIFSQESVEKLETITIGIVFDGDENSSKNWNIKFREEIDPLFEDQKNLKFILKYGDWDKKKIENSYNSLIENKKVDIVLTEGAIGSNYAISKKKFLKPVISSTIISKKFQKAPFNNFGSGVNNLYYIDLNLTMEDDLVKFKKLVDFKILNIIIHPFYKDFIPLIEKRVKKIHKKLNFKSKIVEISEKNLTKLPKKIEKREAVYIIPLLPLTDSDREKLFNRFLENRNPTFSLSGKDDVKRGVLASQKEYGTIFRKLAITVQKIVFKDKISNIPVDIKPVDQFVINMVTLKKLGIDINWRKTYKAETIYDDKAEMLDGKLLSLPDVIKEVVEKNLEIWVQLKEIEIKKSSIKKAKLDYYPKLEVGLTGVMIDEDRAKASFGMVKQRYISGSLTLTQLIYSDKVFKNIEIQEDLEKIEHHKLEQMKQDMMLEVAHLYLNMIRAKTYEKIQKERLSLTKKYLKLAKLRKKIGVAGPGEIYRWESQMAIDQKNVIEASGQRKLIEIAVNRLLNRDQETKILTKEISLNDPYLLTHYGDMGSYIENIDKKNQLKKMLIEYGENSSSELKQIDKAINAQKSYKSMIKRSLWAPTVALQAKIDQKFWSGGAKSSIDVPAEFAPLVSGMFTETDDTEWSIGLNVSLDIFNQGKKWIEKKEINKKLAKLYLQKRSIKGKLEQRVRSMVEKMAVSYPVIELSKDALEAAEKSLQLITDAYAKGMVSIEKLLEVQNATTIAKQFSTDSVYNFLIDLMSVQRAIGKLYFSLNKDEKKIWNKKLKNYLSKDGGDGE